MGTPGRAAIQNPVSKCSVQLVSKVPPQEPSLMCPSWMRGGPSVSIRDQRPGLCPEAASHIHAFNLFVVTNC